MTKALVPLADGCEEMEAVIIIDTLRRAGWEVVAATVDGSPIEASRGVRLVPDCAWDAVDVPSCDLVVLPGGNGGTERLAQNDKVLEAIRSIYRAGKIVAAVCAGPLVLQAAGILEGHRATCHPGAADDLTVAERLEEQVVVDGTVVTSQGPGTTFAFALTLVAMVDGQEAADQIGAAMVVGDGNPE